jgi:histidyl-tRNA synthetase
MTAPRNAPGCRDLRPDEMFVRQRVIDVIREICELYGYVPLYTPAVERLDVLYDGLQGEQHDRIVSVTIKKPNPKTKIPDQKTYGLRFDLTVPLARFVASETSLALPFRRYQVVPVWRPHENPMEFTMFDLDAVGVESEVADTEIITAMCEILRKVDPGPFKVRYSSREILASLFQLAGVPQDHRMKRVFQIISLRDKIDVWEALRRGTKEILSPELTPAQVDRIRPFMAIRSSDRAEVISRLKDFFAAAPYAVSGIAVVERMSDQLGALGYGIDLSVTRDFDYYTGPVFEATLTESDGSEPIFFGGRYDNLVGRFSKRQIAGTGASIHVDRLIDAITRRAGSNDRKRTSARVLVANTAPSMFAEVLKIARDLRESRIETQLYAGKAETVNDQLGYAREYGIPVVVAYEQGDVRITATTSKLPPKTVPRAAIVGAVQTMLNELDKRGAATSS